MKRKPFIPAWLDDANLTAAEMRTFVHLLRSADHDTSIAWPSYQHMTKITGLGKSTIRRSIGELIARNLIEKIGKPFGDSCRYRVLPMVPPEGQMENSNSSTRGTIEAAPIVPPEAPNSPSDETSIVPPEGQEGTPLKVPHKKVKISSEGFEFADWFRANLPPDIHLRQNWRDSFAKIFDDLVRIDERPAAEIRTVCEWARTDNFWKTNFWSPAKLRDRNKQGIKYYDVFLMKMNGTSLRARHAGTPQPEILMPT